MFERISEFWCKNMHTRAMWPIHGRYICPQCLREHAVVWESPIRTVEYREPGSHKSEIRVASTVPATQ